MFEAAKIIAVLAWPAGILLLFSGNGGGGIAVLLFALFMTVATRAETRKRREEALVESTTAAAAGAAAEAVAKAQSPTTSDRLAELETLKASEQISKDEYQAKRKSILDGL